MSTFSQVGAAPKTRLQPLGPEPGRGLPKGTFLVATGAFLLTLALLLPLYVHDRVAPLPAAASFDLRMTDQEAAYLDTATWTRVETAELEQVTRVEASAHGSDWSAWEMTVNTSASDQVIDHWSRRVIVDRETGRAVNCCGEHVNGDRAVRQAGLVLYWPPGVPEGGHSFYDAEVRSAPSVEFDENDEVAGVPVRRYTQTVDRTQVPESARDVPAALFDPGAEGTVRANRWLTAERTFWVEPVTGMVVNMAESRSETLRPQNGSGEVALLDAELTLADGQVSGYAEQARTRSLLLRGLDRWAPWTLGPVGMLAILAGLVTAWRARTAQDEETPAETEAEAEKVPEKAPVPEPEARRP
ncbi:DUF3068 domain-containing protein [Nocardiopsis valliformis]|uniref:DUF3068 domain-containing protein n=1 Tax=Nocardiopsis valliformis TaxID=239974 RepID=UPI00034701C0|nr:DUF3068 domain-containing protein [Nocardiopsis valliformis]